MVQTEVDMNVALDRPALYYPYIHIRDANWLKATLLCFPQVRRMVPRHYPLKDLPEVAEFRGIEGIHGEPLLIEEPTDDFPVDMAQYRLFQTFESHLDFLLGRYSQEQTEHEYQKTNSFEMHIGKMYNLLLFLEGHGLAWHDREEFREDWFSLHPKLGEAIMSVMAIAIARDKGLDIVTPSRTIHRALASLDESAVVNNLLERYEQPMKLPAQDVALELVDELAEVVMTTSFDVSRLTPQQIGELAREGKGMQKFKNELLTLVAAYPDIPDPEERRKRLEYTANEVIKRWKNYKKSLPKYALEAMASGVKDIKAPDLVKTAISGSAAGLGVSAASTALFAAGAGLGVALIVYSGLKVWNSYVEKKNNPYQYLSRLEKYGAVLTLPAQVQSTPSGGN
jgi:hypothetical protein